MDQHFKLLRADEEIARLNLEIRRLVTYMRDEERFLRLHEQRLRAEGSGALAHQVNGYRMERGRFDALHMERLVKLSKEPGFTASLSPGVSVSKERHAPVLSRTADDDVEMPPAQRVSSPPNSDSDDSDEGEDLDAEHLSSAFENIMHISNDAPGVPST
jgi:hypothetical protein